jgi:hypothetical protein
MWWRDVFADKQLASMDILCPGQKNGCQFIGPKNLAMEHAMMCEYIEVECINGCKKMLRISEFPKHLETECGYRVVECELCKHQVKKIEMEVHLKTVCPKQMVQCENCHSQPLVLREKVSKISLHPML